MAWYKNTIVKEVLQEVADEQGVSVDQVRDAVHSIFQTILSKANSRNINFFRIRGFGAIVSKGFKFKKTEAN